MIQEIVEIRKPKPLTSTEKRLLKSHMRAYHGAVTEIAKDMGVAKARLYEAVKGEMKKPENLNAIRKFLNSKKVA